MKYFKVSAFLLLGLSVSLLMNAQKDFNAIPWPMRTSYNSFLNRIVHKQYQDRISQIELALQSSEGLKEYQSQLQKKYKQMAGDFPAKGELNAKVVNTHRYDGFSIENIIFESVSRRFVTCNLYLPDNGKTKHPAALELCGHGQQGKIPASDAAVLLAKNGIAVLIVDPIGQGERVQLIDKHDNNLTRGATTEHTLLNVGCNLLGSSLAMYEFWDNHRAIDYLLTRDDIDESKIGVFGSSGGGTQTTYMIGLDERIQVAAICSFFSLRERTIELQGVADGCQHIPGEGKAMFELSDFVTLFAPKPALILCGKYDFVDFWGTLQGFNELKKVYRTLGNETCVDMLAVETGHGLGVEKQYKLVAWFKQWLMNDKSPVRNDGENPMNIKDGDLLCTANGQVNNSVYHSEAVMVANLKISNDLASSRTRFLSLNESLKKKIVLELLGISIPDSKVVSELTGQVQEREYCVYKYMILREEQMPVACAVAKPDNVMENEPIILYLFERGKNALMNENKIVSTQIAKGGYLIAADLRGCGETAAPLASNDTKYWNTEYRNAMISQHIGRPIMGQRVIDLMSLLDFISGDHLLKSRKINIIADGLYGPIAIHTAYLDKRINSIEILRSIKSYNEYIANPLQRDMISCVLYGVLQYYDLPDMIEMAKISVNHNRY